MYTSHLQFCTWPARFVRATPRQDPRIMTEEPSVLGMPDYYSYKNNNDDQTAFSLLFKRCAM